MLHAIQHGWPGWPGWPGVCLTLFDVFICWWPDQPLWREVWTPRVESCSESQLNAGTKRSLEKTLRSGISRSWTFEERRKAKSWFERNVQVLLQPCEALHSQFVGVKFQADSKPSNSKSSSSLALSCVFEVGHPHRKGMERWLFCADKCVQRIQHALCGGLRFGDARLSVGTSAFQVSALKLLSFSAPH